MKELRLNIPKHWIELNNAQLLNVSRLMLSARSREDMLVKLLYFFSGIKLINAKIYGWLAHKTQKDMDTTSLWWHWHKKVRQFFVLSTMEISDLSEQCSFILDEQGEVKPLKRIRFAVPFSFRLYDASFEHFLMAENYFAAYSTTHKEVHLNNLCAVLYRIPFTSFNSDKIQRRAKWFRSIKLHKKYTVFLWYAGFRNFTKKECKYLFAPGNDGKRLNMKEQINTMMRMVNHGDISLNHAIKKAPLWDALYEMEAQAEQYFKLKEQK